MAPRSRHRAPLDANEARRMRPSTWWLPRYVPAPDHGGKVVYAVHGIASYSVWIVY